MNMTKETKVFIGVGLLSVLIVVAGIMLTNKTQAPTLEQTGDAKIEVLGNKSFDWGQIDMFGGNVEKTFKIKNVGNAPLEITNFKTSCMCTETQVIIKGNKSPVFGMHTRSSWKATLNPGEEADVLVVFDPKFHGPQAVGPIVRLVSFNTNDANNPTVEFKLTGVVVNNNK